MPFPAVVDLDDIAAGTGGFKIQGENAGDYAGVSVSGAGDVNGDGIDDLIIGAHRNASGGAHAGAAYVVFGTTGGFTTLVDLGDIVAGSGGFQIQGENEEDYAGRAVAGAGDINGDGVDDLIVGAHRFASGGPVPDAAYVVFGNPSEFATPIDLAEIAAGDGGFKIQGENAGYSAGFSISGAGDVNADGIDDLIVGARGDDGRGGYTGAAYVVFGRATDFSSPVDLDAIAAGDGGFKIQGQSAYDYVGSSVSAAGDINGDGIDDLIIGADGVPGPYVDDGYVDRPGAAYVVFGTDAGFSDGVDLNAIAEGHGGFKIENASYDLATWSVSGAGDINGDGIDDLIVGTAYAGDNGFGSSYYDGRAAYVVFGRTDGVTSPVELTAIAAGDGGFKIIGENAYYGAGHSVSAAGDVNGDGIDDLIVGVPAAESNDGRLAGASYVVFGLDTGFSSPVDLAEVAAGKGGFKIQGENAYDMAGFSVSAAGDVNGDGIDDLIVGAPSIQTAGQSGAAYVIFGQRDGPITLFSDGDDVRDLNDFDLSLFPGTMATDALAGNDTVILSETQNLSAFFDGNDGDDTITGSAHRDRVRGDEGDDVLRGNRGWDQLEGGFGDDTVFGGIGDDRIVGQWGSNQLWGGIGADTFVCGGSAGLEMVNDFEVGIDKVEVRAQGRGVDVTFDAGNDATLVSLDGIGAIVRLLGVEADAGDLVVV